MSERNTATSPGEGVIAASARGDGASSSISHGQRTGRVAVAVYDGSCRLCRGFASIVRRMVSPVVLDVIPCDSAIQKKLAPEVDASTCRAAFTLVEPDGRVLTGGDAAAAVVTMAPNLARYRWMVERGAGNWLARTLYRIVSLVRGRRRCGGCGK